MLPNTQEQDTLLDDIIEDTMYYRTFFGNESSYYEERRERLLAGSSTVFNPYAFFLGFFWMAYRKMYVEILVLAAVTTIIECLIYFAFEIDNPSVDRVVNLVWAIIVGLYANTFYIKKATRTIEQAKEMYANTSDQLDYVEKQGGTSAIGPVIVGIVIAVIFFGLIFLEDYTTNFNY
ncbi:DUF2628 domain-containing protein [Dysgonomonas sp. Marseille-P4677]|uniref:DUF2628 domain-containing protein n=1 Tax=Dysgonomonas sp. Marseille-P4677 TaxID=2364790 RepID=UPI0019132B8F|nr:DUF2628 domain-containing protein [Dysgonomonas sp. Marseille-P4677]MBK5722054.1 DUF2628 domain-containing protein [Dysgonomonas sp. Marseille-P4677]